MRETDKGEGTGPIGEREEDRNRTGVTLGKWQWENWTSGLGTVPGGSAERTSQLQSRVREGPESCQVWHWQP